MESGNSISIAGTSLDIRYLIISDIIKIKLFLFQYVDSKLSKKILKEARLQQRELEAEHGIQPGYAFRACLRLESYDRYHMVLGMFMHFGLHHN